MAKFLTRHLLPVQPITPSHIILMNGCTTAIEHTARCFTDAGEYMLLGRPYYTAFLDDATLRTGTKLAEVSFGDSDPVGEDCVAQYEKKLLEIQASGGRVSALMLCHPHNPLGRCYPRKALVDFMKLCQKYQIHLISDEIYALSIFKNDVDSHPAATPFESILSIDPTGLIDPALIHVLWGMSKDFGANGIRLGAIISQNNQAFHNSMQPVGIFGSLSSLTEHVTMNVLGDDEFVEGYIKENQRMLGERYEYMAKWCVQNGIEYAPGANAGFFIWLNLGKKYLESHPDTKDLDQESWDAFIKARVFLAAGFRFGGEVPGCQLLRQVQLVALRLRTKRSLLLSTSTIVQITNTILCIKLDANLVTKTSSAAIQTTGLDARHVRHDLELGVQRRTAVSAEEMLVDFTRVANGVPSLGRALCDLERSAGDNSIGRECSSGPLHTASVHGYYLFFNM
ncbi:hypothetical protein Golomagni_06647 [Golovinomyces magnicellulatus]|nr:hypothetical protein Golomagni_06647 [Golovinomyces magnicellulatus]